MVLDAGCGEGRNAVYLAGRGALVHAVDVSATALANGRAQWPDDNGVTWQQADLTRMPLPAARYDAVIACSVLHWLAGEAAVERLFSRLRQAVKPGGLHALVVFNDRLPYPEDTAPSQPTLLAHDWYLERYAGWHLAAVADRDSTHTHPGDSAPHAHAISRIIARRPEEAAGERPARHDDQSGGQASDG